MNSEGEYTRICRIFRKLNLNKEQIQNLPKTDLVEKILSDYIGKRVMALKLKTWDNGK